MTTTQVDLWGGEHVAGDVVDRLRWVLREYPETRASYRAVMVRYWLEFDGLDVVLGEEDRIEAFAAWFRDSATSSKTLQNRTMELQREADLEPPADVRALRDRQARQGPGR